MNKVIDRLKESRVAIQCNERGEFATLIGWLSRHAGIHSLAMKEFKPKVCLRIPKYSTHQYVIAGEEHFKRKGVEVISFDTFTEEYTI
jgi:hypothetical protein